ncbi:hypothetical protein H2248_009820 [Termitomyces sp. 'cryptogamus']|nr:hypothetical protein H2248_009820 [Termitomyces sp. 'cryptogamus']
MFHEQQQERGTIARRLEYVENLMDPLETLEKEIWKAYGLDGELESERLFKECQRRVAAVDRSNAGHYVRCITSIFEVVSQWLKICHDRSQNQCYMLQDQIRDVSLGASQDERWMIAMENLHLLRQKKVELLSRLLGRKTSFGVHSRDISANCPVSGAIKQNAARFWAVVIGIDFYAAGSNLDGAVNDAKLVYDYLRQDLGVPESNIKLLLQPHNSSSTTQYPTRAGILDALYTHLRDNTMVTYGDNIFIYFAGHGSLYRAAHDPIFTSIAGMSGTIEAICPADHYMEEHLDDDYTQVAGIDISDRELNIILSEIGKKHGNHITVILDCCHFGMKVRNSNSERRRKTRYLGSSGKTLSTMLAAADRDPRRHSDSPRALNDRWCFDFSTHVMIGACQDNETANEISGHGLFTMTFLNALRSSLGRNPDTTYNQLIDSPDMRLPFQTPAIAGSGQDSTLWFQKECLVYD